ncbi:hypothetical protein K439DRAFT_1631904 [Ramaria rubella]|nr:hypothetical protein K439DRAFT_1631904 [Ramaria rubella]
MSIHNGVARPKLGSNDGDEEKQDRNARLALPDKSRSQEALQTNINAVSRTVSAPAVPQSAEPPRSHSSKGSFGKSTLSSMMGNLSNFSSMSISRDKHSDQDSSRGRSASQTRPSSKDSDDRSRSRTRTRSVSPFLRRRSARRDASPHVEALPTSDLESDTESIGPSKSASRPRNSAFSLSPDDSASEGEGSETDYSDESWSDGDLFDDLTELNTERNALTVPAESAEDAEGADVDPLGEGVNVVVPPEPLFPTTLHGGHGGRKNTVSRRKTARAEHLPFKTSRPTFQRDRCTIRLTNGDPIASLEGGTRKGRRYVVASDLSMESKYAVEWCIGTVMRDGDEMIVVTVTEAENKLDPVSGATADRVAKLRNQQERQTLAYLLVRQATSLLQRTRLNVTVVCQAWHAKNSRHLLLDLVDFTEPTMLIVGSRGLGKIKGILLGSTSHYLIQKSSVPVMVARRRLKRPPKRNAHLSSHRARVPLSEAAIDKAPSKVENDVEAMRDEIARDDTEPVEREEGELDPEAEGVAEGSKISSPTAAAASHG